MNILKLKLIAFSIVAILGFISIGCNKDINSLEPIQTKENKSMDTEENLRKSGFPCYPVGGDIIPHITSQEHCEGQYGFFWVGNKCWACY